MAKVIITGGSSGLGLATGLMMRARGDSVTSLDLQSPLGRGIDFQEVDVASDASVAAGVAAAAATMGGIDIVVNSAGVSSGGDVEANSDEEWARSLNINVTGIARVCRHAVPHLRMSSCAVIVNIASIASHTGLPNRVLYSATKGAVSAMTLAMATDYLGEGIRVNAVAPGTADTPWVARLLAQAPDPDEARRSLEARQPIGRLISADEVALAICYLTDERAASSTGVILTVDGGMHTLAPPR